MAYDAPKTYEQIFASIDRSQVVLVSGEQDNTYVPGGTDEPPVDGWDGLRASGTVAEDEEQRWETPTLPAGAYEFRITGSGDSDLYVRIGSAPTVGDYDCRPYRTGSDEVCTVQLPAPAAVHVMVRGWAASSSFELTGEAR
jgi:serine protease